MMFFILCVFTTSVVWLYGHVGRDRCVRSFVHKCVRRCVHVLCACSVRVCAFLRSYMRACVRANVCVHVHMRTGPYAYTAWMHGACACLACVHGCTCMCMPAFLEDGWCAMEVSGIAAGDGCPLARAVVLDIVYWHGVPQDQG